MKPEELTEYLKDEKNAAEFKTLVATLGYVSGEDVDGLKKNQAKLLDEKKKLQSEYEKIKKMIDEIDIEEYNELRAKSSKSHSGNEDELAKLKRDLKKTSDDLRKIEDEHKKTTDKYESNLKRTAISEALDATEPLPFDPKHKKLLLDAFLNKSRVENDDVIIETGDGLGLPAKEFFKKFAETEIGKLYLSVPDSSGVKSRTTSQGGAKTIARTAFEKLSPDEQHKIALDATYQITD